MMESTDPELIALWALECYERKFWMEGGVARKIFVHPTYIRYMAYIPEAGWSMDCRYGIYAPYMPNVYVVPTMRGKGYGTKLWEAVLNFRSGVSQNVVPAAPHRGDLQIPAR